MWSMWDAPSDRDYYNQSRDEREDPDEFADCTPDDWSLFATEPAL
jgi:hypothetical protein